MTWLISNWRLKLLALGLALGLLGAVAFSENPLTVRQVQAPLDYDNPPGGLAIASPPSRVPVNVYGLSQTVNGAADNSAGIRFHIDLGKINTSGKHTLYATPRLLPTGVSWTGDPVPVELDFQKFASTDKPLPIELRTPNVATGYKVLPDKTFVTCGGNSGEHCKGVTVTGPESMLQDLVAYVQIDAQVNTDSLLLPSQPVKFEQRGHPIDLTKQNFLPTVGWAPSVVDANISAQKSTAGRQVSVKVTVTGRPACGYQVQSLTFSDPLVTLTGPPDVVAKIDSVTLPNAIDVTNATSTLRITEPVSTDPGITSAPTTVTVTLSIGKAFDCTAPTPSPKPT